MNIKVTLKITLLLLLTTIASKSMNAQVTVLQDYLNYYSANIGTFQGIKFRESGFSGIYMVPNSNGKEYWIVSDRGVNVDAANANSSTCRPTYDKIYGFANYAPKIHRVRLNGDSVQILQTITIKRPNGTTATGLLNPTGYGSTAAEVPSTDTVLNCANFNAKTVSKDVWGIDAEGIVVDKDGNFWLCEEGGPTIWKLNANGVVTKRFTPYALTQPEDVKIDSVFKYRKNNRGFEGITITPNGKIYAIIQSPILYPNKTIGEGTRVHRILEIDPTTNATRMLVYLNDGIIGASGSNQIRLRDWKIGDMAAINDSTFLVIEAALRGTTDVKKVYTININKATAVNSGLYSGVTLEALVDSAGLAANNIVPVKKTLYMDLFAKGWNPALDKAEGIAIVNDSTIVICNDNDYGQTCPLEDGIALTTTNVGHIVMYSLKGSSKLNYKAIKNTLMTGKTGPSTIQSPYLLPSVPGASLTSILTAGDVVNGYKMCGLADGTGAYDNGNGTFTYLVAHEMGSTSGVTRAHGSTGAFVSKWIINKNDLSVVSGSDLIRNVNIWNGTSYTTYNSTNPSSLAAFGRFCSADLPPVSAFYNATTGLGTKERIFMNGEESGSEGRAFAHIATGTNAGTSYELPYLGKFSWENSMASPYVSNKTIVVGTDDATPGQVYFYIGTKTNTGSEINRAGLVGGKLFGVAVSGLLTETSTVPTAGTAFSLVDLGTVQNMTGAALNTASNNAGVTTFLRPEDGAWDPSSPNDFYFVTTNAFTSPSRLWKLHFTDIANPELGGTITAVLDGTEGPKMMDNIGFDNYGHILIQEDPGNQSYIAKVWQYTIATDVVQIVSEHDQTRFLTGGANFLTQDEEASGIIDAQEILGPGMFLMADQAHYGISGEVVEGGQLLAFYNPDTYKSNPEINLTGNGISIPDGDLTPNTADNSDFGKIAGLQTKTFVIQNSGPGILTLSGVNFTGTHASDFSLVSPTTFPVSISAGNTQTITVKFIPAILGVRNATMNIVSNDFDESTYNISLQGISIAAGQTGASSSQSPYLLPSVPGASLTSILTAGDVVNGYKMCGLADGTGAYDNGNGTFTYLVAHEMGSTSGVTRAHGSTGAFVSKWIINKNDLSVVSGSDLIRNVNIWNGTSYTTYNSTNPSSLAAFGRFCSADLPPVSAFYNATTGLGTKERIFMNGEESGSEGRAFAHIATGTNAGTSYELPYLGKFSWENSMASPYVSNKTIVVGTDDATPGQVYFYIGTKTNTGSEINRAGLVGGKLFGVAVSGLLTETSTVPTAGTAFSLVDLGTVQNMTGAALNTASNNAGVTTFLRPEDGAWDPSSPNDFYFVTTNAFTSPSRLWKLHFTDIANPELGGTITAVLDGTEGPKMMDNIGFDNYGHILIQEDPGNQSYIAKVWQYTIATDVVQIVSEHDQTRFLTGGANFLTQDEEASGIIDAQEILGPGMFLMADQAHYGISGEVVEGGQLLAFYNPDTYKSNPEINVAGNNNTVVNGDNSPITFDNTDFGSAEVATSVTKTFTIQNNGVGKLNVSAISLSGVNAAEFTLVSAPTFPLTINGSETLDITVKFTPTATGVRTADVKIMSNDFDEALYTFALQGLSIASEINVQGNGLNIANGDVVPSLIDNTDFGSVKVSATTFKTFTIQNTGTAALNLSALTISGANASEFTLLNAPALPLTLAAGNSQTIVVQFAPLSIGARTATLTIGNTDADESSYVFNLQGTASSATKINATLALNETVKLYPNPVDDKATLLFNFESNQTVRISIYDLQGKEVVSESTQQLEKGEQTMELNTSMLGNGIYFVQIASGNQVSRIKIVIIH
ncbi:MAG: choice-of-anchor D domain-containing protein [Bacteroidota bacterium]